MALSAEDRKEVQEIVSTGAAAYFATDAGKKVITDLVSTGVGQATTELSRSVAALTEKVTALGDAGPEKGKDKPDPVAEAVKAGIEAALKPINDRFAAMDAEKARAAEASTREVLIKDTLASEKYSALTKHGTFIRALHAAGVKTADEVKAALQAYLAEQKELGIEIKPTAASPEAEGAKRPDGSAGGAEGKGLTIEQQRERLKEIKRQTAPVPVTAGSGA